MKIIGGFEIVLRLQIDIVFEKNEADDKFGEMIVCFYAIYDLTLELSQGCIIFLMNEDALQIGEISNRSGVSVDTVRYYEKRKLIHSVSRTYGGFRLFKPQTIEQIKFIKQAQELGFALDEIKGLLGSESAEECRTVRELLQQKISEVDEQIKNMKAFRKTLSDHLKACDEELNQHGKNANCPAFFEIKRGKK